MRWWLYHLPAAEAARAFLFSHFGQRRATGVAPTTFDIDLLRAVAADFRGAGLDGTTATALFSDITRQIDQLIGAAILSMIDVRPLGKRAFLLATYHDLSFDDAVYLELAEDMRLPLLVADEGLLQRLLRLTVNGGVRRIAWIGDVVGPA